MEDHNNVVILELDRPRELKLTHKVMKRFLKRKQLKMEDLENGSMNYELMVDLICEMLRREQPDLTEDACDDLLDAVPIGVIMEKGAQAIHAACDTGAENPTDQKTEPASL